MRFKLSFLSIVGLLLTTTYAQSNNCTPTNCSASCSPACSIDDVCTMGTMITCGVCPGSKCFSRAALGLPPVSTATAKTSSGSGALIGGIVGGIFGGGLLICGLGYLIIRHRRKNKNSLPLAFRSPAKLHRLERTSPMDEEMLERNNTARQVMSGVIPVTFIPPSRPESSVAVPGAATPEAHQGNFSTFANQQGNDNPFSDRPISNAHSIMSTTTHTYSRRGSMESTISHRQTATVVHATQITRAKPQIMRVNTIKPQNSITRSGSLKSIQPERHKVVPTAIVEEENPFDDINKVELSPPDRRQVTDSVVSAPGDGEITIFWNGS